VVTDWSGAEYTRRSALQRAMVGEALDALVVAADARVLDIGCGDGFLTGELAARAPHGFVVGADASPRMIATARAGIPAGGGGAAFVVADARSLPLRGGRFDLVVSFNALHWVPEQHRALAEIAAVLRPGGRAVVQVVCASERTSLEATAMAVCRHERWAPWFEGFASPFVHVDPQRYGDLATAAGLTLDELTVTDRRWNFGSRDAFHQWCAMGTTAWTGRLPTQDRDAYVADLVSAYEPVAGAAGLFRYAQMRATLRRQSGEM
jgi:trans-aconitate 2-methyltransferase